MKISDSTSSSLISPSVQAQESSRARGQSEAVPERNPAAIENSAVGKDASVNGKTLPASAAAAQATDNARGLANAIDQLQKNSEKNPQATGLLRALETLTERQTAQSVNTEA